MPVLETLVVLGNSLRQARGEVAGMSGLLYLIPSVVFWGWSGSAPSFGW